MTDGERLECNDCGWSTTGGRERERVAAGIYHAIGTGHEVSEENLVDRYDELEADAA